MVTIYTQSFFHQATFNAIFGERNKKEIDSYQILSTFLLMKRFKDLTIHLTISFHWRHFPIFIQSSMIQYWHSKKALFHFTPQKQWCDLKTSKETTLWINLLSIDIRFNSENCERGSIKKSSTPTSFFQKVPQMVENSPKVARMAKNCQKFQNHVVWKHGKKPLLSSSLQRRCTTKAEAGRC